MHVPRAATAVARTRSPATCSAGSSPGAVVSNVFLAQRRPALPRRGQPPGVRHPRVRLDRRPRRPRQGGGAHPRGPARRRRARLAEEGIPGDVYLFKNNTDSAGNSYGCHENYLVERARRLRPARRRAHPVPRHPADHLRRRQGAADAARAPSTASASGPSTSGRACRRATTRSRPIINTRDEPHADAERYRRLHVIVGDSNMSEPTTLLKVGATDLVLRMLESGVVMRDLTLENPIRAIREISHDTTGRRTVRLVNGREPRHSTSRPSTSPGRRDFASRRGLDEGARQAGRSTCGSARSRRSRRTTWRSSSARSTGSTSCA